MKRSMFAIRPAFVGFLLPVGFVVSGSVLVRVLSRAPSEDPIRGDAVNMAMSSMNPQSDPHYDDPEALESAYAAYRRGQELRRGESQILVNPFYYHAIKKQEPTEAEIVDDAPVEEPPPPPPPPIMRLTGIMRGRSPVAVINDSIVQVGQFVEEDWKVVHIDTDRRFVVVECSDGRRVTLHPEK